MWKKIFICIPFGILIMINLIYAKEITNLVKTSYVSKSEIKSSVTSFVDGYETMLTNSRFWINGYGVILRCLNKYEAKQFEVVRDENDYLYIKTDKTTLEQTNKAVISIEKLYDKTKEIESEFLFVQCPYKNYSNEKSLNGYGVDYTVPNDDAVLKGLEERNIPIFNLRDNGYEWTYYKTDHHWTCDSAIAAARQIIDEVNVRYDMLIDKNNIVSNSENYEIITYEDALLGSAGIRVGEYYVGKDDVNVYVPKFETKLNYKLYVKGEMQREREGDFSYTFIDWTSLNDKNYYNKYNAFLYGGWNENIIQNYMCDNELKCLLVTHSYGRPLVQYLSLFFAETRYLDPQSGRYEGNYLEYIETYKPDIVIVMYNSEIKTNM